MSKEMLSLSVDSCCSEYSEGGFATDSAEDSECETPKHEKHKIPNRMLCPSPPRKKRPTLKSGNPPPSGFFNPPELEIMFAKMDRTSSCV